MRSVGRIHYIHFLVSEDILLPSSPLSGMAKTATTGWLAERRSFVSFLRKEGTPSRQWPGAPADCNLSFSWEQAPNYTALLRRVAVEIWDIAR
jgi:hypothetical protein